ncbi:hypothetical protein M948_20780 [Virgibacillus sp. CM-4]|uniref:IrrE N-terminal-like domain-containing protein n=1 Tax=Virgibacillus massiliensis TaxID=1462526 RepID=A0A024QGZ2_9BACI|nr:MULTISPECIES: ImmA/IrrE family metallo-endopeptidase [Virgibacillus]EQB34815.1 hypothetical protein M948_20780 [Virgibacillus sp. CM-4]CDQ41467.1 hypothetical protein BN990_03840 [Virgibacillus massiliensis]
MLTYTRAEEFVYKLLKYLDIQSPRQLNIENISKQLGIKVQYWNYSSELDCYKGRYVMSLELKETMQEQWQEFAHELCHFFWHEGRQEFIPILFLQLQEWQANNFSYHLSVPTFMLQQIDNASPIVIANTFNVEYEFACHRFEMYRNKLYFQGVYHEHYTIGS